MIFTAKNKDLASLLSVGLKLLEKPKKLGIKFTKKDGAFLRLLDESGAYYHCSFPAKIIKDGQFSIDLTLFEAIIKAKNLELEYTVEKSRLNVKSLNSKLAGKDVPLLPENVVISNREKIGIDFGKYQSKALVMLSECALPSFFQKVLPQYIISERGFLTVACADTMYSAIASYPIQKLNIPKTSIPAQYARLMKEVVGDDLYISIKKEKFIVHTDIIHTELPMLQLEEIAPMEKILALDSTKNVASFNVELQLLRNELDNLLVVHEEKSPVHMKLKNNLLMNYRTNHGSYSNSVKIENVKNSAEWYLDVEMLRTILSRCNGKVLVEVKPNVICFSYTPIKDMKIKYIIAKVNAGENSG